MPVPAMLTTAAPHDSIQQTLGAAGFAVIALAAIKFWQSVDWTGALSLSARFDGILEGMAMPTIALASLDLADTVLEEELKRESQLAASARVRRVLARCLVVVVVVSLAIESLVAVFHFVHEDPSKLIHASAIAAAAAVLLIGWGVFVRMNRDPDERR